MNQIVVGMGEALWDCLPEGKKIGGAPATFASHVSQFGFDSRVVSAVALMPTVMKYWMFLRRKACVHRLSVYLILQVRCR